MRRIFKSQTGKPTSTARTTTKLLEIKKKWDPKGVFYATTAVGRENWVVKDGDQGAQTQNGRLCRV